MRRERGGSGLDKEQESLRLARQDGGSANAV